MLKGFNFRLVNSFRQAIAQMSRGAIAFFVSLLVVFSLWMPSPAWAAATLGMTRGSVQANFEHLGYQIQPKTETAFIGKSSDGVATVRLNINVKDLISGAALTIKKPFTKQRNDQSLGHMAEFLNVMLPEWGQAENWLPQAITDAIDFGSTDLVVGDRRIYLLIPKNKEALLLAVDPLNLK